MFFLLPFIVVVATAFLAFALASAVIWTAKTCAGALRNKTQATFGPLSLEPSSSLAAVSITIG